MYSESTLEEINNLFQLPGEKDFCQCVSYGLLESARLELGTNIYQFRLKSFISARRVSANFRCVVCNSFFSLGKIKWGEIY